MQSMHEYRVSDGMSILAYTLITALHWSSCKTQLEKNKATRPIFLSLSFRPDPAVHVKSQDARREKGGKREAKKVIEEKERTPSNARFAMRETRVCAAPGR